MVETGQWILIGATGGFAAFWLLDGVIKPLIRPPAAKPVDNTAVQQDLQSAEAKIADLERRLGEAQSSPVKTATPGHETTSAQAAVVPTTDAIAETTTQPAATPTKPSAGLEQLTTLDAAMLARLQDSGVTTVDQLAALSVDDVLAKLDAQPWDMIDPAPWIDEASALLTGNTSSLADTTTESTQSEPVSPTVPTGTPDDLTRIDGIDDTTAAKLAATGLDTYLKLGEASEDAVLEAIDAQPWDMVDAAAWIAAARKEAGL